MDYTEKNGMVNFDMGTLENTELYGLDSLQSIAGCVHIVLGNLAEGPFTSELRLYFQRFYVKLFHNHCTHYHETIDTLSANEKAKQ